jgi:hypothetical protein
MSTNLRKAQKHMQRATELLNQGQLGFGTGPPSTVKRLKINGAEPENKQGMFDWEKLPRELKENIVLDPTCAHACRLAKVDSKLNKLYAPKCLKCKMAVRKGVIENAELVLEIYNKEIRKSITTAHIPVEGDLIHYVQNTGKICMLRCAKLEEIIRESIPDSVLTVLQDFKRNRLEQFIMSAIEHPINEETKTRLRKARSIFMSETYRLVRSLSQMNDWNEWPVIEEQKDKLGDGYNFHLGRLGFEIEPEKFFPGLSFRLTLEMDLQKITHEKVRLTLYVQERVKDVGEPFRAVFHKIFPSFLSSDFSVKLIIDPSIDPTKKVTCNIQIDRSLFRENNFCDSDETENTAIEAKIVEKIKKLLNNAIESKYELNGVYVYS